MAREPNMHRAIAGCRARSQRLSPESATAREPMARASRNRLLPNFRTAIGAPIRPTDFGRSAMSARIGSRRDDELQKRRAAHRRHRPGAYGFDAASRQGDEADRGSTAALARSAPFAPLPHAG